MKLYQIPNRDTLDTDYSKLINCILNRAYVPAQWIDDARQVGYQALYMAYDRYLKNDGCHKSAFSTYAWWIIRSHITTFSTKIMKPYGNCATFYRNKICCTESIEALELNIEDTTEQQDTSQNLVALFCRKVNGKFSEIEVAMIIDYYIHGMSYTCLKKQYGNIARSIKKLNLTPIFDEIKKEIKDLE